MIHPNQLQGVERAIRKYVVLAEEDPIVRILLAGVLANFAPDRDVPVWLVIVGNPGSAKTDLISLVQNWRHTYPLAMKLTAAYFFSSRTGSAKSALGRIHDGGYRLLYMEDMASLVDGVDRLYAGSIYQQLRGIHDGFLKTETGLDSVPLVYGTKLPLQHGEQEPRLEPLPARERLGWLGAATPAFYAWQARHNTLGSRFTCYLTQTLDDWTDPDTLMEIERQRAGRSAWRKPAETAVQNFLDSAIAQMDEFPSVTATDAQSKRLAAAVKLVQRINGTISVTDTGARLHARLMAIVRMIAFISGKQRVTDVEVAIGHRVALSQLPREQHAILQYGMSFGGEEWDLPGLLRAVGGTRRIYDRVLHDLVDVGILKRARKRGWTNGNGYALTKDAIGLIDTFSVAAPRTVE